MKKIGGLWLFVGIFGIYSCLAGDAFDDGGKELVTAATETPLSKALEPGQVTEEKESDVKESTTDLTEPVKLHTIILIPPSAKGHEEACQRFLKGALVFRPQEGSDIGRIVMPIANLKNPFEDEFDLSKCGSIAEYFCISTGYRNIIKEKNADKVEVWLVSRFLAAPADFKGIRWTTQAEVAILWNWGGWKLYWFDSLASQPNEQLSVGNLYRKWYIADKGDPLGIKMVPSERLKNFSLIL